jgi:large subunit ribosomal protein L9
MKVVLIQDQDGLGFRGETVTVSDGYARNFLIPRAVALRATPTALRRAEEINRLAARKEVHVRAEAQTKKSKLDGTKIEIEANAGDGGKLFGSVTSGDIVARINQLGLGYEVDKKDVLLRAPLKALGVYTVPVKLFRDVQSNVEVWVVSNQPETPAERAPKAAAAPVEEETADPKLDADGETTEDATDDAEINT